jgi:hypothetical protein
MRYKRFYWPVYVKQEGFFNKTDYTKNERLLSVFDTGSK